MNVSYYPGCSLEGTAIDYAASIGGVASLLDLTLTELDDWNCCGATAAHSTNHHLALALPARNLALAEAAGRDVVVPCALCFNRLKVAEKALKGPEGAQPRHSLSGRHQDLGPVGLPHPGRLPERVGPQSGAAPDGPQGRGLLRLHGGPAPGRHRQNRMRKTPRTWSGCCRSWAPNPWTGPSRPTAAAPAWPWPGRISSTPWCSASMSGPSGPGPTASWSPARCARPTWICPRNASASSSAQDYYLPVFYFTELIGLALGHPDVKKWLAGHLVDPMPLLRGKGLIE